jgi:cbb3-type cytochrome oxidase maturation protein
MTAMYMLIAFSLVIATGFVLAFIWAIRSGQYDDKYTPSVRVLFDDDKPGKSDSSTKNTPDHSKSNSDTVKKPSNKLSTQTTK